MELNLPAKVQISKGVLYQEIEGEGVLLNLATEQYFGLDAVGTKFWKFLAEDETTAHALARLHKEYEVEQNTLARDLSILLADLKKEGLVTIEG